MAGAIPSPNIWGSPDTYELENRGVDRAGAIESAMRAVQDWAGLDVLDIGCGTGFHLPRFARSARSVVGVEPHLPLLSRAATRVLRLTNVGVVAGSAEATGLAAGSIDVAHARWAYFFGPGCGPGLAELSRVVRPGGVAFVIDNDVSRSTFGQWFQASLPAYDGDAVTRFWSRRRWTRVAVDTAWTFDSPADFAAALRIELPAVLADRILAADPGRTGVDYAVNLWWRRF